jgi:hypothetical protein
LIEASVVRRASILTREADAPDRPVTAVAAG